MSDQVQREIAELLGDNIERDRAFHDMAEQRDQALIRAEAAEQELVQERAETSALRFAIDKALTEWETFGTKGIGNVFDVLRSAVRS